MEHPDTDASRQPDLATRAATISRAADKIVTESRGIVYDLAARVNLRDRVRSHPFGAVLIAAGVGYLVGGGLFTPATSRAVRVGLRLALLPLLRSELAGIAQASVIGEAATRVHQ